MLFYEPTQYKQLAAENHFSGSVLAFYWQERFGNKLTSGSIISRILILIKYYILIDSITIF